MNVIGDSAGQHNSVVDLINQMPKQRTILLGDLNDRGRNSRNLIQFAIDNDVANGGLLETVDSNHGDMFVDWYRQKTDPMYIPRYDAEVFDYNGGDKTVASYNFDIDNCVLDELVLNKTLKAHIDWLASRPSHLFGEVNGQKYLFTHAPMNPNTHRNFEQFLLRGNGFYSYPECPDSQNNFQWNRYEPESFHKDLPNVISVFGHNAGKDVKIICDQYRMGIYVKGSDMLQTLMDINKGKVYGICVDVSRSRRVGGIDLNTMNIYHSYYEPETAKMY